VNDTVNGTVNGRTLVAGVGNVFLRDDAFGVEVIRLLAGRPVPDGVQVKDFGIRGVHLAYQLLDGYAGLLLVDVVHRDGPPGTLYRLEHTLADAEPAGVALDGHDMSPDVVLGLVRDLAAATGVTDPVGRVLVLGCEPADLGDGIGLSAPVAAAVEPALAVADELVALLLQTPIPEGAHP
jgi:hydrogenase maturation protease